MNPTPTAAPQEVLATYERVLAERTAYITRLFEAADADRSGKIDYDEFTVRAPPRLCEAAAPAPVRGSCPFVCVKRLPAKQLCLFFP
jgi:hypothetical protein